MTKYVIYSATMLDDVREERESFSLKEKASAFSKLAPN